MSTSISTARACSGNTGHGRDSVSDTGQTYLARAIDESDFAWSPALVGEDQSSKPAALTADLRRAPSTSGDGKQITSGYSYWGTGPAIAWARAATRSTWS
ncbi:hypothetical protein ACTG9Q_31850 [Actinokineospora sp. 24-640]